LEFVRYVILLREDTVTTSPLTTAAILEWQRRSAWGGAAAAPRAAKFGLVAPEDGRPMAAETMILPLTPDESWKALDVV